MRKLYVTRGIPGSGKSTLLQASGLGPYTLSPDSLRLAMGGPVLNEAGKMSISAKNDAKVWELMRELLQERMARGEVVAVDATHTAARYYNEYAQLAYRHRYKMYIVDLSGVPLEQAQAQNDKREPYKVVDPSVLREMHDRVSSLTYPKGWEVLRTTEEIKATLEHPVLDFSAYERVHHIGDIQGCYTPLAEYMQQNPLREDEVFVFIGDLLDRGRENDKVLTYILHELAGKPNVYFVEGNHDLYIWQWANGWPVKTREFNGRTRRQLEAANLDLHAVKSLIRSMVPAIHYHRGNHEVLVTHAGLSTLPDNLGYISAQQCIRGVGAYEQVGAIDDAFVQNTNKHTYQIHGHRNRQQYPLQHNERCFNLEGGVEFGGSLRIVQLGSDGFTPVEVTNSQQDAVSYHPENKALVRELRANRLISERTLPENISSFHYKPEVMFRRKWSRQTMTTRGLFINTLTNEIVIRAYDKFFSIGETRQTEYSNLQQSLKFPVTAWVKENGYLGLVGYDDSAGDLVVSSKSTTEGEFADWFRDLFERHIKSDRQYVVDYVRDHNATLLFEVILPQNDPHIIDYARDELVLLEVVKRQRDYQAEPEAAREAIAQKLGIRSKQKAATLTNWQEFEAWYASTRGMQYERNGKQIEGFVIEDAEGWHVKIKLDYYTFWKQMRSALDALKKGKTPKIPAHCAHPEEAERVIAFMQNLPQEQLTAMAVGDIRRAYSAGQSTPKQLECAHTVVE